MSVQPLTETEKAAYKRVLASFSIFIQREYKDDLESLYKKTQTFFFPSSRDPLDAVLDKQPTPNVMEYLSNSFGVQDVSAWFLSFERTVTLRDCSPN